MTKSNERQATCLRLMSAWIAVWALLTVASGCAGPRMKLLGDEKHERLAADEPVDIFVGELPDVIDDVGIIDSRSYPYVDDDVKLRQIEELRAKARRLGANAVQDVRILAKVVKGYVLDEHTPFTSWKQGEYEVYFMRGLAVSIPEREPSSFDEIDPRGGWVVDRLEAPQRIVMPIEEDIPMPSLRLRGGQVND